MSVPAAAGAEGRDEAAFGSEGKLARIDLKCLTPWAG